ncbi:UDP-N-acetylmuramate--L-alanine ligase [bacterium]|nr:UDP-N-acetylmuramate--L-alanine ligase [bacterium]
MQNYHFIAIGGIGMSGLAKYLLEQGFEVSGSDVSASKYILELEKLGAKVHVGHDANNLPNDSIVVVSSAIKENNPELQKAKLLGMKIYHRSDLLKEISEKSECFIGFAGCHGKTTTSGLAAYVLEKSAYCPSYVVGGIIPEINTNGKFNSNQVFIAELDESDGTIQKYLPDICVINNLDEDHVDYYTNGVDSIVEVFNNFISKLKPEAKVLINIDCEHNLRLKGKDFITYGIDNDADYKAENIVLGAGFIEFDLKHKGSLLTHLSTKLIGTHNVYNTLAVAAALIEAGFDIDKLKKAFSTFTGMKRRFQLIGEVKGALIYDDYAHHPTEVKALLSSLKSFKDKNITAVFQPHRYTRLQKFWNEFIDALKPVENVIITDVFAASENPVDGINSENFANDCKKAGVNAKHINGSIQEAAEYLYPNLTQNDVIISIGAGSVTQLGTELLKLNKD